MCMSGGGGGFGPWVPSGAPDPQATTTAPPTPVNPALVTSRQSAAASAQATTGLGAGGSAQPSAGATDSAGKKTLLGA